VFGNYRSTGGTSDSNALKTSKANNIQFVPHKEHRVLRLRNPVGDHSMGKWHFVVRFP